MSTYLVAFVICDFKTMTDYTKTNNISVSVIAAEDKLPQVSRLWKVVLTIILPTTSKL